MARQFDIREPSIEALRSAPVYFRYGSNQRRILIDALTARAILIVHDALASDDNRAKIARMVAGTPDQLRRVADFAFKHVSIGG